MDQKCKVICNGRVVRKQIFKSLADHIDLNLFDANDPKVIQDDPDFITWRSTHDDVYPPVIFPPDKAGKRAYVFRSEPIAMVSSSPRTVTRLRRLARPRPYTYTHSTSPAVYPYDALREGRHHHEGWEEVHPS